MTLKILALVIVLLVLAGIGGYRLYDRNPVLEITIEEKITVGDG